MSDFNINPSVITSNINIQWENADVWDFYENIPVKEMRNYAIKGGLENGCDIDLVYPYIANTHSLIDTGSCYGRVIKHLLRKGYQGKIYAVECSKNFCAYLKKNYQDKADITLANIKNFKPPQKVDAILWMWSGINDFSKNEQLSLLKCMYSWLNSEGILILETLLHTLIPKNAATNIKKIGQNITMSTEYGNTYGYLSSNNEIQSYGKQLGFLHIYGFT